MRVSTSLYLLAGALLLLALAPLCAADAAVSSQARQQAAAPAQPANPAQPAQPAQPAKPAAEAAPAAPAAEQKPPHVDAGGFRAPEIGEAQVAGLAVGAVFLLIFIPGFLCLFNIQTPETFAMLDSNEMKKKLQ